MIIHNMQQGTPEWLQVRRGKFTASTFKSLMATKTTQTYNDEIYRVAYERLTGESPEDFVSDYMKRGTEMEPLARQKYEFETFNEVAECGFFEKSEFIGCSPDGLVDKDGIVEFKCPKYSTMIKYLLDKRLPSEYKYQVHSQLWITEREWCDFGAYHPKLPMFILRVYPDQEIIKELETETEIAIEKVKQILKKLGE